jgi:hypothetical protein
MGSLLTDRAIRQRLAADGGSAFNAERSAIDDRSDRRAENDGTFADRLFA